jgi:hypothetical protein
MQLLPTKFSTRFVPFRSMPSLPVGHKLHPRSLGHIPLLSK